MPRINIFSDGSIEAAAQGNLCEIWSMKTWAEVGQAWDGSFSQTIAFDAPVNGTGGVTNRLTIRKPEIDFIKSLNVDSLKTWRWAAAAPTGTLYQSKAGYSVDECVDWNWVGTPSGHIESRNVMCFFGFQNGLAQVAAAPKSASYEQYRNVPWLIQNVYGNYGAVPLLYKIILLDPSTFPHTKGNGGFWIEKKWLHEKVGTVQVPWLA